MTFLNGHLAERDYHYFKMTTTTFIELRVELIGRGLKNETRNIKVDEQLQYFYFVQVMMWLKGDWQNHYNIQKK